jgi:hypothetical protein
MSARCARIDADRPVYFRGDGPPTPALEPARARASRTRGYARFRAVRGRASTGCPQRAAFDRQRSAPGHRGPSRAASAPAAARPCRSFRPRGGAVRAAGAQRAPPVAPPRLPFPSELPRIGVPVATVPIARVGAAVSRRALPRVRDFSRPSRLHAARRGTARVGSGSASLVLPSLLARHIGLTARPYVDADPAIGALVGLPDLALGAALLSSLDNPLRLRLAVALDSVVDTADAAALALPLGPRRVAARGAVAGAAVALRSVALWRRALASLPA